MEIENLFSSSPSTRISAAREAFMNLRLSSLLLLFALACNGSNDTGQTSQGINRIPCQATPDCAARGGTCTAGQCVADNECAVDSDCAAGEVCTADTNFGGLCGTPGVAPLPGPAWTCATDADCPASQSCTRGACGALPVTPPVEDCTNTTDDDGDGDIDCADSDCAGDPACAPPLEDCANGVDDDGDGDVDCSDVQCVREPICNGGGCNGFNCPCDVLLQDCASAADRCYPGGPDSADGQCYPTGGMSLGDACVEPPVDTPDSCTAGLLCIYEAENDPTGVCRAICAGSADCAAGELCFALFPAPTNFGICHTPQPEACGNGLDDDSDGDTDCADSDCAQDPSCAPPPPPEDCANGLDDDGDGDIDCFDLECARQPGC
jgi:Cys-rich repeat protein